MKRTARTPLSALLTLAMLLALVPAMSPSASADGEHSHVWSYTADGAGLTAKCEGEGECAVADGLTLTLSAPEGALVYDGAAKPAAIADGYSAEAFPDAAIAYTRDGAAIDGAPTDAGSYTASVTMGGATASVSYAIEPKSFTPTDANVIFIPPVTPNGQVPDVELMDNEGLTVASSEYTVLTNAASHQIVIWDIAGGNYVITPVVLSFPFEAGMATVTKAPTATEYTYNTETRQLLASGGTAANGSMRYALGSASEAPAADSDEWKTSISGFTAVNAGTYYIWYKAVGDGTLFQDSVPVRLTASIAKAPLTVTANDVTGVDEVQYGEHPKNGGVTVAGFLGDDGASVLKGTQTYTYSYSQGGNVQAAEGMDYGVFEIIPGGVTADNYEITFVPGVLHVYKKTVTVTASVEDKEYDGTAEATLDEVTLGDGVVEGDALSVDVSGATALFDSANAGENKTVTVTGVALTGAKASNYKLSGQPAATASITRREVELDWGDDEFAYDGAEHAPTATVANAVEGDTVTVTVTGAETLAGDYTATATELSDDNYVLPEDVTKDFTITVTDVTVTYKDNGEVVDTKVFAYSAEGGGALYAPVKAGFLFKGWKVDPANAAPGWDETALHTTVPAGAYGEVTLLAEWEFVVKVVLADYRYAGTGYRLLLAGTAAQGTLLYDGTAMFSTDDANYLSLLNADGDDYATAYVYLVPSGETVSSAAAKLSVTSGTNAAIDRSGDVDGSGRISSNDWGLVNDMLVGGNGDLALQLSVEARLRSDLNATDSGSQFGSIADVNAILEAYYAQ